MNRSSFAIFLALSLTAVVAHPQDDAPRGTIRGTVVNEEGQPVAGVFLWAEGKDRPGGFEHRVVSDGAGRFTLTNLWMDTYQVLAVKEGDGYPDTSSAIYDNGKIPVVELSASERIVDARVTVGPKAAVLTGSITDASTGKPAPNPRIRIWRWTDGVDRNIEFLDTDIRANYRFLIPPSKEVGLEIYAEGYETWSYRGESSGEKPFPLYLPSGAQKTINVQLRPIPK